MIRETFITPARAWPVLVLGISGAGLSSFLLPLKAGDADDLVWQALQSERRLNYVGERLDVFWTEEDTVAVVVQEYGAAGGKRRVECRIPGQTGKDVFIENGRELWYSGSTRFRWQCHASPSLPLAKRWQLLQNNYDFYWASGHPGHVAGRPAQVIEARPREPGKGYLRLWVDPDSPFILRIERFNAADSLVSLSAFETIRFNPSLSEKLFQIEPSSAVPPWEPTTLEDLQSQLGPEAALPSQLPYGYQLQETLQEQEGERLQAHLLYTDGLDTISLFALRPAPRRNWRQLERSGQMKTLHGHPIWINRAGRFHVLNWQAGEVEQSLVTELPKEALPSLARVLIPRNAPPPQVGSRPWLPALLAALLVFLLLRRCLRPRWL